MGQCQTHINEINTDQFMCCGKGHVQNEFDLEQQQENEKSKRLQADFDESEDQDQDKNDNDDMKSLQQDQQNPTEITSQQINHRGSLDTIDIQYKDAKLLKKSMITDQKKNLIKCPFQIKNDIFTMLNDKYGKVDIEGYNSSYDNKCYIPSHKHNKPKDIDKLKSVKIDKNFAQEIKNEKKIKKLIEKLPTTIEHIMQKLPIFKMPNEVWYKKYKKDLLKDEYYYINPKDNNSGYAFKGMWLDGKPFGFGRMIYFVTSTTKNKFEINIIYIGEVNNGKANGVGRMIQQDGTYYEGYFFENQFHGHGKLIKPDGFVYEGQFLFGKQVGIGSEIWPNGSTYRGGYLNGKKHGEGKFTWQIYFIEQDEYWGFFKNDLFEDFGIYKWADGRKYIGYWLHGKMQGYGEFIWPDGSKYQGFYESDHKNGYGIMYYYGHTKDSPKYYEGFWCKGAIGDFKNQSLNDYYGQFKGKQIIGYFVKKGNVSVYIYDQIQGKAVNLKKQLFKYDKNFKIFLQTTRKNILQQNQLEYTQQTSQGALNNTQINNQQTIDVLASKYAPINIAPIAKQPTQQHIEINSQQDIKQQKDFDQFIKENQMINSNIQQQLQPNQKEINLNAPLDKKSLVNQLVDPNNQDPSQGGSASRIAQNLMENSNQKNQESTNLQASIQQQQTENQQLGQQQIKNLQKNYQDASDIQIADLKSQKETLEKQKFEDIEQKPEELIQEQKQSSKFMQRMQEGQNELNQKQQQRENEIQNLNSEEYKKQQEHIQQNREKIKQKRDGLHQQQSNQNVNLKESQQQQQTLPNDNNSDLPLSSAFNQQIQNEEQYKFIQGEQQIIV